MLGTLSGGGTYSRDVCPRGGSTCRGGGGVVRTLSNSHWSGPSWDLQNRGEKNISYSATKSSSNTAFDAVSLGELKGFRPALTHRMHRQKVK